MKNYSLVNAHGDTFATIIGKSPTTILKDMRGTWKTFQHADGGATRAFHFKEDQTYTVDGGIVLSISPNTIMVEMDAEKS